MQELVTAMLPEGEPDTVPLLRGAEDWKRELIILDHVLERTVVVGPLVEQTLNHLLAAVVDPLSHLLATATKESGV